MAWQGFLLHGLLVFSCSLASLERMRQGENIAGLELDDPWHLCHWLRALLEAVAILLDGSHFRV